MENQKKERLAFIWEITAAHVIAYFFAGIFALFVIDYKAWFSEGAISTFMLPTDTPIVALGPALQVIRGLIMGLVLLPFRKVITESEYGFFKLWLLIIGLSLLSTFSAAMGSLDGFIYTNVPIFEQILGYPEAVLWCSLFVVIFKGLFKSKKRWIHVTAGVVCFLILFMSIMGYLQALESM